MTTPRVIIASPRYSDEVIAESFMSKNHAAKNDQCWPEDHVEVVLDVSCKGSLLPFCFNTMLALALDKRDDGEVTHFAMIHSDVVAPFGWLNTLWRVMRQRNAVVVSAVIPIKEPERTRTTTAIGSRRDPYSVHRFINTSDRPGMPETFSTGCVARTDDEVLLVNTGLWLADLSWEGWDHFSFRFQDEIRKNPETGRREALVESEDWNLSRFLDKWNAKYCATWEVPVRHYGPGVWDSHQLPPVHPSSADAKA